MRISDWSSDVCSSDLPHASVRQPCASLVRWWTWSPAAARSSAKNLPARRALAVLVGVPTAAARVATACPSARVRRRRQEAPAAQGWAPETRSEEHTSELQSLMRISYAVFCLKKKTPDDKTHE